MVGRKHIEFWNRLWRGTRFGFLALLILALPSTAFSYRMSQTVSCGNSSRCSPDDPLKALKQANREFKSVFQVTRETTVDKATVKNSSKKTGFIENLIDTAEEVLGRFSRSIASGRNKRPSISVDGMILLTSWFSNHYFAVSSSVAQCLSSTPKTWNAIRFRGRGPLSLRNPSSATQTSEGFAHIFQTGSSGLQLVENIDIQSYSREVANASYSLRESGCEGNSESFDAIGSAASELGDLNIIYGNNSFVATGEGTNPNMVFAMEQASQNDAFFQGLTGGVFSGFFTAVSSATAAPIQTVTFTPTGNGKTFNISRLTDFADSSSASAWGVLTLNQLNSPAPGFHQGTLTQDGQQGQALCMVGLLDDQNTLVCSAQLPSNTSVPVYMFATMTPKASVKMTAPSLVGMPGQEVCGDIILEGATQSTTAQLTPSSYYWGPGAFSGQNGQCAGSSATGVAQVGALETCNVRICTLIAGASLDFNFSFQEDEQTTAQEFASVSFQEPPAPVITASSDIDSGTVPLFVNFSALEVSGNITSWLVDFGDGYQSTYYNGSNPYLFHTPGEFLVSVKGVNSYGQESNTVIIPISVLPVSGCMNSMASNYNPSATVDDGSCQNANGGSCSSNSQCVSGNCSSGICNAGGSNGTACSQNYECSSNACNYGYCDGGNLAGCTSHAWRLDQNGKEHFYCFVSGVKKFSEARYSAPYVPQFPSSGYLVTITSQEEQDLVWNLISSYTTHIWLNLTDVANEGTWIWGTGEPYAFTNWESGEPNNGAGADPSGEHFAHIGANHTSRWNDAHAWHGDQYQMAAVYEYDLDHSEQTPNPNCTSDYDGDGVCAGVDSDDNNSRVTVGPELATINLDSGMTQIYLTGNRLGNMNYIRIMPQWVQDYINWGWWPEYYADWYSSIIYYYQCSYNDSSVSCPFYLPYNWGNGSSSGTIVVNLVDHTGAKSNALNMYIDLTPSITSVEANPTEGWIKFEGNNLNTSADPFSSVTIGDWYQNYYISSYDCSTVTNSLIICPYSQARNYYGQNYGYFYTYNSYYYAPYFTFNIYGCTNPSAGNYVPGANIDNGSCDYTPVLVSHWKFDGDYNDYGTLGNHASYISSGVSLTSGGVAQFNGSANYGGSYIDIGSPYSTLTSSATTVSFWYKADTVANNPIFIDFKMGGGDTFITLSPGSSPGTHRVFWAPRGWGYTVGSQEYAVNGWTQVTIVYNGNGMWNWGGSEVSFYINGNLVGNTSWECCNGGYISYTNQLGRDSYSGQWGDNSRAYSGSLDDVRVYRGNLSSADISNLYNERASLYFSGVLNGACYKDGTIVSYLSNGTGYCSGNEKYYMNDEQTTLDANGSGVHGGLRYIAGSLANGFVSGAGDDNNTVLLLHMDGGHGSTTFMDSSSSSKTASVSGQSHINTTGSKFGGASAYFDGSGDYISYSSPTDFTFGNGDFTVELWFNKDSGGSWEGALITTADPSDGQGFWLGFQGGSLYWLFGNGYWSFARVPTSFTSSTWHHVAVTRSGNIGRLFLDGIEVDSVTDSTYLTNINNGIKIGGRDVAGQYFPGFIDEVRVSNLARYTSNFTPATEAFGAGGCFSNGVDTGTMVNGTGACEGVYYVAGTATTLPLDGTGQFNGKEYVNGVALSGLFSDTCYNDGVVVNVLVDGTGYCSGNLTFYFMGTAQTNFDGMGSGTTADGQVFVAGSPANTVVNGVCYNNGFATNDLINGSGKCLSNGQWYIDGIYASRLDNLGNGTWGFNLAATPGKETSSPPGFIDSAVADETAAPGNYVWIAPRWGTAQKLNILTGTVVSNLSIPGGVELVKSGDYVWALHVGGSGAHRVHRSTDQITSFYDSHFTQGYGAAASDGYLWLSDPNSPILKKVHGETGALIATADFSSALSGSIRSIRTDSLKIAIVAGSKMSFVDKTNLSIVRTIELPNDGSFTANEAWIMAEGGGAWFLSGGGGYKTIYRYDYHNNTGSYVNITIASIEGCAVNSTGFWVPSTWGSTMYHVKFDGTVDRTIELSSYGIYSYPKTRLAVGETVWVSTYQPQLHLLDFPEITYSNGQPVQ